MPTFAGYDLQGEMVRWRNFVSVDAAPSRAILVSVFASWCEPCRDGLVVMEEIASGDPNLELLLINFQETEAEAAQFLRRLNITEATVIVDQYGSVSSRLGVDVNLPRTFLVDGAGRTHTIFTLEGRDFDEVLLAKLQEMRTANGFTRARERAPEILDHMDNVIDAEQ
jgi:thiol-disulfide isomerase/thioredoxin